MARIYTRTGDRGETGLIGGVRAPKSDRRVDLYGTADELSACLGVAVARLRTGGDGTAKLSAAAVRIAGDLEHLQSRLFDLGALLADPGRCTELTRDAAVIPGLDPTPLEAAIDRFAADLAPLRSFVLPGGSEAAASLHVARTVCRRLERLAVAAAEDIAVPDDVLRWLNRLSDWLFIAARWLNQAAGVAERPWRPEPEDDDA